MHITDSLNMGNSSYSNCPGDKNLHKESIPCIYLKTNSWAPNPLLVSWNHHLLYYQPNNYFCISSWNTANIYCYNLSYIMCLHFPQEYCFHFKYNQVFSQTSGVYILEGFPHFSFFLVVVPARYIEQKSEIFL